MRTPGFALPLLATIALSAPPGPPSSAGHVLVYSPEAGGVLLLHGESEGPARLWLFDGSKWKDTGPLGTASRSLPACAYDGKRKELLLHGGALPVQGDAGNWKADGRTLAWNGKEWKVVSETGPAPRDHHAMVYDSARKRIVLFGGSDADRTGRSDFFGDTWEWDGKAWARVATTGPGARCHHAMAFDPVRKRTVLVGGYGPSGPDGKTWEWDGTEWKDMGQSPVAFRTSPRVAFDGNRKRVVLFGGERRSALPTDTWEWTGSEWVKIAEQGPPGRTVHGLAFDEARKVLVLFGGAGPDPLADTWVMKMGTSPWGQLPQ